MKFTSKIKNIIKNPKKFFHLTRSEGIKEPFLFMIGFILVLKFFLLYFYLSSDIVLPSVYDSLPFDLKPEFTVGNFVLFYLVLVVYTLFFAFVRPLVAYWFFKMFNNKVKYKDTFKSISYGNTPSYLVTPFYIAVLLLGVGSLYLDNLMLHALFIVSLVVWLCGDLYAIYVKLIGMSKLHKVSKLVAFLCAFIFPLILLIVVELIVIFVVATILFLLGLR